MWIHTKKTLLVSISAIFYVDNNIHDYGRPMEADVSISNLTTNRTVRHKVIYYVK